VDFGLVVEHGACVLAAVVKGNALRIVLRRVFEVPPLPEPRVLRLLCFRLAITQIALSAMWVENDRQRKKGGAYEFRIL